MLFLLFKQKEHLLFLLRQPTSQKFDIEKYTLG
jgi:hypothetical protein